MENKEDDLSEGLINLDIKLNQKNQKIVGKVNEIFEDILCEESNNKNRKLFLKTMPSFTKYNLYIYLIHGNFAKIGNIINNENIKYRIYLNPNLYQESTILTKNNISNMNKEIYFQVYLPCFIDRIVVEFYHKE